MAQGFQELHKVLKKCDSVVQIDRLEFFNTVYLKNDVIKIKINKETNDFKISELFENLQNLGLNIQKKEVLVEENFYILEISLN